MLDKYISYMHSRVKSLSKGNNSKRDLPSSTISKDSNSQLSSSSSAQMSNLEGTTTDGLNGSGRFGWSRGLDREASPSPKLERVPSGRADNTFVSGYSDYYRGHKGGQVDMSVDDYDNSEDIFEQEKPYRSKNKKAETYNVPATDNRMRKNLSDLSSNNTSSDDDLNVLLKVIKLSIALYIALRDLYNSQ